MTTENQNVDGSEVATVDEFHKHELMDRVCFLTEILDTLREHSAHTPKTRTAFDLAFTALHNLYLEAAAERFAGLYEDSDEVLCRADEG